MRIGSRSFMRRRPRLLACGVLATLAAAAPARNARADAPADPIAEDARHLGAELAARGMPPSVVARPANVLAIHAQHLAWHGAYRPALKEAVQAAGEAHGLTHSDRDLTMTLESNPRRLSYYEFLQGVRHHAVSIMPASADSPEQVQLERTLRNGATQTRILSRMPDGSLSVETRSLSNYEWQAELGATGRITRETSFRLVPGERSGEFTVLRGRVGRHLRLAPGAHQGQGSLMWPWLGSYLRTRR